MCIVILIVSLKIIDIEPYLSMTLHPVVIQHIKNRCFNFRTTNNGTDTFAGRNGASNIYLLC